MKLDRQTADDFVVAFIDERTRRGLAADREEARSHLYVQLCALAAHIGLVPVLQAYYEIGGHEPYAASVRAHTYADDVSKATRADFEEQVSDAFADAQLKPRTIADERVIADRQCATWFATVREHFRLDTPESIAQLMFAVERNRVSENPGTPAYHQGLWNWMAVGQMLTRIWEGRSGAPWLAR